jgi:hypothetical protein
MEIQDTDSLPRVETVSISNFIEGHPTSDGYNEESAPSLNRAQPHPLGTKMKPYNMTISTVVGLYLVGMWKPQPIIVISTNPATALLCSISHYVFFDRLHGSIASGEDASIPQSYATFISLLLITLFKASLLGCVGLCSTQYLWRVLRGQPIALSTVESLFQMRHNPLELFYRHTILSLSFLLAVYTWIVPLATIYPSGALTISATPFVLTESVQMSVPELTFDSDFDPFLPENVSRLAMFAWVYHGRYPNNSYETPGTVNLSTNLQAMEPQRFLVRLSETVIAAGEIAPEPPAAFGENSTYMLEFMGPQLSCRNVELLNQTPSGWGTFTDLALGEAKRDPDPYKIPELNFAIANAYTEPESYEWQTFQQTTLGGPCKDSQTMKKPPTDMDSGWYLVETTKTNCTDIYVRYNANITYTKGVRSIHYTMHDIEPQPVRDLSTMVVWEAARNELLTGDGQLKEKADIDAVFVASPFFQRSKDYLKERYRYWNAFTIYAAFIGAMESATLRYCTAINSSQNCDVEWTKPDGSRALYGPVHCFALPFRSKCINVRLSRTAAGAS